MELLQDGLIAFFAAVGVTTVVWLLASLLLRTGQPTVPGLVLALPLRGEAPAMEEDVRELCRTRRSLPGAKIILADCGLSADARALAEYLARREPGVALMDGAEINVG